MCKKFIPKETNISKYTPPTNTPPIQLDTSKAYFRLEEIEAKKAAKKAAEKAAAEKAAAEKAAAEKAAKNNKSFLWGRRK